MSATDQAAKINRLLAALPRRERERVLVDSRQVELVAGEVLCDWDEPVRYAYFPTSGFISLLASVDAHARLEVGLIGNEGMFGVSLVLGVSFSPQQALVQGPGAAVRIGAPALRRVMRDAAALRSVLSRYACVQTTQYAQVAACVRFHPVNARLARWLLMTQDRAHAPEFRATQETLANMLGVRRAGVAEAAGALRRQGLIRYTRGAVTVLDRQGLEAAACRCYRENRKLHARLMK